MGVNWRYSFVMAKWGQGDPRWIVEERPDAKNVNNWHWCVFCVSWCLCCILYDTKWPDYIICDAI